MSHPDGKKAQTLTALGEEERASLIEDICNNVHKDFADANTTIVGPWPDRIEEKLNELSTLRATVSEFENAVEHTSAWMYDLVSTTLHALISHVEGVATALTMRLLDIDVHRRKWTLNIQGVNDALPTDFAACQGYDSKMTPPSW